MESLIEKNKFGNYAVYELAEPLSHNKVIENKLFTFTSLAVKFSYEIKIFQNKELTCRGNYKYLDSYNFCIQVKQHSPVHDSPNWFTYVTLSDQCGNFVTKSEVTYHSSISLNHSYPVLSSISSQNLKTLKCNAGQAYLHIFLIENTIFGTYLPGQILGDELKTNAVAITNTSHHCKFSKGFADLYENKCLVDTVIVSESKEFDVHKTILSARSSYFYALFKNDMQECQSGHVLIKNSKESLVKDVVVENFIQFMYTGIAKDLEKYAFELYELAHMYNVSTLQEKCIAYWKSTINIDNAMIILIVAKKYGVKELLDEVSKIFTKRAKEIFNSKNVKKLIDLKSSKTI